jgi:tRNA (cytidine/uridine-2'-O-)-methyltransferase
MLNVVLVEPEIPPNTGSVGRLCLATGSHLHLVKPLGFSLDDRELKRAGLDYWRDVKVTVWESFEELRAAHAGGRFFFLTTKATRAHWDEGFRDGDFFVFGRETKGLPKTLLAANAAECLTIPMPGSTRSLNLATAVAIVLYEALRQFTRA